MSNLKEYRFNELYQMDSGISTSKEQAGHGAPFVSFKDIYNNPILPDDLTEKMDTSIEEQKKYSVKKGDIFLTRTSEVLNELAMSSVAIKDYPNATFSGFAKRLRPIQSNITYDKFMAFYLRSIYFRKVINAKAVMTLRASFNEKIFSYIELLLPDYDTQVKAGDLFYDIERKIRNNNKINLELESMARTIYDYWFLQFEFPNEDGKPYKSSGGRMVWNEELKREIPEGWKSGRLNQFIKQDKGGDWGKEFPEGNYIKKVTCLRGADFPSVCGIAKTEAPERFINEKNTFKVLKKGDLIIEISGGSPTQSTGRICYISTNVLNRFKNELITSNFCKAINLIDEDFLYWFYNLWRKLYDSGVFLKYEGKTTGIKNLLFEMLCRDYPIIIPDADVIKKYNNGIERLFDAIQENLLENAELSSLRDFLLPLLMNGQVGFKE